MEKVYSNKSKYILGLQHVLAMFGATVLVPSLTGMDPTLAIFCAGVGTLLFHFVTGGTVPVFLGSSFAFMGAIALTLETQGVGAVKTGIIFAGLVYVLMSFLVKTVGVDKIKSFFPPIVNGPIIMVIGLRLSPVAISMAGFDASTNNMNWLNFGIAFIVVATIIIITIADKSFFKLVPILIAITVGYIVTLILDSVYGTNFVNTQAISSANWFGFSSDTVDIMLTPPEFNISAIVAIAPIAIVVFMEHIGDITTNGAVVGKDFFKSPGIHKTMLGDGVATIFAGLVGGPANTTYGENTGVLAVTKVYDPSILRIAAVYAILLSLFGKFGAIVSNIPTPIMGGVSIILFGMIASIGVRTLVEAELDFAHSRNLIIASVIFVLGIGVSDVNLTSNLTISGLAIAGFTGVFLNKVLPSNI